MDQWIELENGYLTNQPRTNPKIRPTEAWLFVYKCCRAKKGIKRKRDLEHLCAVNESDLDELVADFAERDDVVLIETQNEPMRYLEYKGEPKIISIPESSTAP